MGVKKNIIKRSFFADDLIKLRESVNNNNIQANNWDLIVSQQIPQPQVGNNVDFVIPQFDFINLPAREIRNMVFFGVRVEFPGFYGVIEQYRVSISRVITNNTTVVVPRDNIGFMDQIFSIVQHHPILTIVLTSTGICILGFGYYFFLKGKGITLMDVLINIVKRCLKYIVEQKIQKIIALFGKINIRLDAKELDYFFKTGIWP